MKKIIIISIAMASIFFFTVIIIRPVSAQTTEPAGQSVKPIPADVLKVVDKSCIKCHKEPGNAMALTHVNLTKWDKYSPEKQASKAQAICKMVTKGKMPPKGFRKDNPDAVPTQDDIKILCDWAATLQVPGK